MGWGGDTERDATAQPTFALPRNPIRPQPTASVILTEACDTAETKVATEPTAEPEQPPGWNNSELNR